MPWDGARSSCLGRCSFRARGLRELPSASSSALSRWPCSRSTTIGCSSASRVREGRTPSRRRCSVRITASCSRGSCGSPTSRFSGRTPRRSSFWCGISSATRCSSASTTRWPGSTCTSAKSWYASPRRRCAARCAFSASGSPPGLTRFSQGSSSQESWLCSSQRCRTTREASPRWVRRSRPRADTSCR